MQQAQQEVCLAESDEEDYVSFDEEQLNTGIANLYDDDSASDAASDASNPEIAMDDLLDMDEMDDMVNEVQNNNNVFSKSMQPQQSKQEKQPLKKEEAESEEEGLFSRFFSIKKSKPQNEKKPKKRKMKRRSANRNRSSLRRSAFNDDSDSDSDDDEDDAVDEMYNRKAKNATKLTKRMNLLHGMKQKYNVQNNDINRKVIHRQKVNTNVISIDLGTLKNAADNVATGDAFTCDSCKCILSKHDELLKQYEDIKLDNEDDESIWICKFCNHVNIIEIDNEEIPKNETVDYMLAPPDDAKMNEKSKDEMDDQIIFCIDVSGSMCVTTPVDSKKGIKLKLRGNRLKDDSDALSQFMDPMDRNQWMPNQNQNVTYISRLQCVQSAVDEQITNLTKTNPNYKIGVVTFNNDVTVIGDGMMKEHEIITGDKLSNMNTLKEIGTKCKINKSLKESHEKLSEALWDLKETGQTALGPALVVSIAMASSRPGSQVILCTDGLANIGVGALDQEVDIIDDEDENDEDEIADPILQWYESLGDYAMNKGVIVNIISITDDGCKLENLGTLVEATNGNLKRINPLKLTEKFSGIIENQIIATNAQAKMLLHPGLQFHSTMANVKLEEQIQQQQKEKEKNKKEEINVKEMMVDEDMNTYTKDDKNKEIKKNDDKNNKEEKKQDDVEEDDKLNEGRKIHKVCRSAQDVGNVFEESRIFFEYVINKEKVKEFKDIKELPFQVQISYQKKDGSKMMRVISQKRKVTFDKEKVRKNLNMDILAKYGTKVTTELCAKGDYESSRAWTSANTHFMNRNVSYNNKKQVLTLANYANNNVVLDHQMKQQQISEQNELDDISFDNNNNNNNNNAYRGMGMMGNMQPQSASLYSSGKGRKKKKKARKSARNDKFSNYMYNMSKK